VAAHNIIFTEPDEFEVQPPVYPSGAERLCFLKGLGIQLRRMKSDELRFDPAGTYRESWAIAPNWKANGLQSLYGFKVEKTLSGSDKSDYYGGSVSYQLSNDNGLTWLYHNGTAWVIAGATDWNTEEEIDGHINVFPLTGEKQIRVKIKLTPSSNGQATPFVHLITIFGTILLNLNDDLLRSIKHWIEDGVWISTATYEDVVNTDSISVYRKWEELGGPIAVYNTTVDPGKTTNIFAGFSGGTILMTGLQTGRIEAYFMARPPVYIAAEEFIEVANLPSIVVNLVGVREERNLRNGNDERDLSFARLKGLVGLARTYYLCDFRISCQSDLQHEVQLLGDSLSRAIAQVRFVLSEATGEGMVVQNVTPFSSASRISQGLYVKDYSVTIFTKTWLRVDSLVERDMAQEMVVWVGPMERKASLELLEI